ncbi:MAG: FkbM family methyltransferase [Bacteroidota bacterium]
MQPTIEHILKGNYSLNQKIRFFYRFAKWQVISKVFRKAFVFNFTPNSKLILINGFHALTGNYYFGIAEPDAMPFVLHVLKPNDLFIDIGANGGTYTILASGEKGAKTISIEAAPDTFKGLVKNITLNSLGTLVEAWNVAVSDTEGILPFTSGYNATNRVSYDDEPGIINVEAKTLDNILVGRVPVLIKMDIEGHEHNALLGAGKTIAADGCKAIVIEFSNTGLYYGYGNVATHQLLTGYGFKPFKYNYQDKQLIPLQPLLTRFEFNMIYIKDEVFINERLASAQHILMSGQLI